MNIVPTLVFKTITVYDGIAQHIACAHTSHISPEIISPSKQVSRTTSTCSNPKQIIVYYAKCELVDVVTRPMVFSVLS